MKSFQKVYIPIWKMIQMLDLNNFYKLRTLNIVILYHLINHFSSNLISCSSNNISNKRKHDTDDDIKYIYKCENICDLKFNATYNFWVKRKNDQLCNPIELFCFYMGHFSIINILYDLIKKDKSFIDRTINLQKKLFDTKFIIENRFLTWIDSTQQVIEFYFERNCSNIPKIQNYQENIMKKLEEKNFFNHFYNILEMIKPHHGTELLIENIEYNKYQKKINNFSEPDDKLQVFTWYDYLFFLNQCTIGFYAIEKLSFYIGEYIMVQKLMKIYNLHEKYHNIQSNLELKISEFELELYYNDDEKSYSNFYFNNDTIFLKDASSRNYFHFIEKNSDENENIKDILFSFEQELQKPSIKTQNKNTYTYDDILLKNNSENFCKGNISFKSYDKEIGKIDKILFIFSGEKLKEFVCNSKNIKYIISWIDQLFEWNKEYDEITYYNNYITKVNNIRLRHNFIASALINLNPKTSSFIVAENIKDGNIFFRNLEKTCGIGDNSIFKVQFTAIFNHKLMSYNTINDILKDYDRKKNKIVLNLYNKCYDILDKSKQTLSGSAIHTIKRKIYKYLMYNLYIHLADIILIQNITNLVELFKKNISSDIFKQIEKFQIQIKNRFVDDKEFVMNMQDTNFLENFFSEKNPDHFLNKFFLYHGVMNSITEFYTKYKSLIE